MTLVAEEKIYEYHASHYVLRIKIFFNMLTWYACVSYEIKEFSQHHKI